MSQRGVQARIKKEQKGKEEDRRGGQEQVKEDGKYLLCVNL